MTGPMRGASAQNTGEPSAPSTGPGPRIGSLCSGYGGLDMGVQSVLGGFVAWHVEYDRDPSKILAHHWPDIPNHGDVKLTDWSAVEPVDVLTAGYPCQPFSHAGKRKGADDPRHLWPDVARAVGVLRPRLVVLENVRGHVSLGLADVLGDLSALGYDARWGVVRAADAGAAHGRARIFIVAEPYRYGHASADAGSGPLARPAAAGDRLPVAAERGHLAPADASRERYGGGQDGRGVGRLDGADAGEARERERERGIAVDRGVAAAADTASERRGEGRTEPARLVGRPDAAERGGANDPDAPRTGRLRASEPQDHDPHSGRGRGHDPADMGSGSGPVDWGNYAPAVARWERVIGRPAPRPTEPGRNGPRLSPRFVEWLMGLPAGHVTDVPDLSRNAQLKALGNGVVPQQAALALRLLLNHESERAA